MQDKVVRVKDKKSNPKRKAFCRNIVLTIVGLFLVILLLSGVINQRKTGEAMVHYYTRIAENLGNKFIRLFSGEDADLPLKVTEDGVYLD